MIPLKEYTAGHRLLLAAVAKAAGFEDAVAFTAGDLYWTLIKSARKGQAIPVDGVLVRDWTTANRKQHPGVRLGARIYEIEGLRFVSVLFAFDLNIDEAGLSFLAVERKNYQRLFRIALRLDRRAEGEHRAPVLPQGQMSTLWANTIGYLAGENLARVQALGGRPRRGILLNGEPGNGKTMACRWIWEECRRRAWEWRAVTPDSYRRARRSCDPESAAEIEELKNLLIQHFLDTGAWDWTSARRQFRSNRDEFQSNSRRKVGFGFAEVGVGSDEDWT